MNQQDLTKKTRDELITLCKEKNINGYSGKKKSELIILIETKLTSAQDPSPIVAAPEKIYRLNYIGSKFQLLDWITTNMKEKTGWVSFENKTIGDLFAGTGIVSYYFRKSNANIISNDAELYSSIITHAFTRSIYTPKCKKYIEEFQTDMQENKHTTTIGFVTSKYSPHGSEERKFFTIENAKRIDYIRDKLESVKYDLSDDEYKFILASIILSADAVSNVPAVYGCFLKNFKTKATKNLVLLPVHNNTLPAIADSQTYNSDILHLCTSKTAVLSDTCNSYRALETCESVKTDLFKTFDFDLIYLDPPYNERQYSKNYFPLNIIAKTPESLLTESPLKGKTGIPTDCFISPFCKKGDVSENAFELLFRELKTKWLFLSYNSESIVSKDRMLEIMKKYGVATVIERDYKRFKSFEYNNDVEIKEYLFCLHKN